MWEGAEVGNKGRSDQREGQSCVLVGPRPSSIIEVG